MSDELKNIFDDFDPGVSDEHVEKRWQAIKPLLPSDEKPKGMVIFPRKNGRKTFAIAASLLTAVFVALLVLRQTEPVENASSLSHNDEAYHSRQPATKRETAKSASENVSSPTHEPSTERIGMRPDDAPALSNNSDSKRTGNGKSDVAVLSAPNDQKQQHNGGVNEEKNRETNADPIQPVDVTLKKQGEIGTHHTDSLQVAFLPPVAGSIPYVSKGAINAPINEVRPKFGKRSGKLSLEVFGGINRYNNSETGRSQVTLSSFKDEATANKKSGTGYTYVAGIAAYRTLGTRLFIPLQLVYTGGQDIYREEWRGAIRISRPVVSASPDSARYREYTEILDINQKRSLRAGLGIGIRLLAAPLFSLNAMALGELNRVTYERSNQVIFSETETTIPPTSQLPAPAVAANLSSATFEPSGIQYFKSNNFGVVGSLHGARALGRRTSVTARISYHHSVRSPILSAKNSSLEIRPKELIFCLGFNYRW